MKYIKVREKILKIFLLCLFILIFISGNSYAAINSHTNTNGLGNALGDLFRWIIDTVGLGVLGATIVPLVNSFSVIIFIILYLLFVANGISAGGGLAFPFPDQIVFNKIPLLDPNFINPADGSIASIAGDVFKKLYSSFFVLATSIFLIAALIIGIKLIFSSLAAEKAQYKQALNNWIFGIALLFLVHYILAGMFYLNEQIVESVSELADGVEIEFDWAQAIPVVGKAISTVVNGIANLLGSPNKVTTVTVKGFGGLVLKYFFVGVIGNDFISSITFLIIIGQTFALVISYLKRTIMCLILGVMAPLIVAVDVVQKSLK